MAEASAFRESLSFLDRIGLYDVVLPFLLVFVIVFAMLEKTRVLGTEHIGEHTYPKRSLNSLASFVIAFFVVASSKLVEIITQISSNVVLLVLAGMFFLLLAGSFQQQKSEGFFLEGKWKTLFLFLMFFGLLFIFLNAIKTRDKTWLAWVFDWLRQFMDNVGVSSVVLVLIVIGMLIYVGAIGGNPSQPSSSGGGSSGGGH